MEYLILECHPGYAVALDQQGKFLRVANRNYEIGQTVTDVVEMQLPEKKNKTAVRWLSAAAALAACLLLVFVSFFRQGQTPFASVYLTINPEVRIDVDKHNMVVGLAGVNADGEQLIQGYAWKNKALDPVTDELVDLAIAQGYLSPGGTVTLTLDGQDAQWAAETGEALNRSLHEHLSESITVTINLEPQPEQPPEPPPSVTIPVTPGENYGESDYGPTEPEDIGSVYEPPVSDDGDSVYQPPVTGDGDSNYEPPVTDDGNSGYGSGISDDGSSNYGDSGYDTDD